MKITGIGVDIENIFRFRKLPYKKNRHFYEKIFTESEIKYCLSKADPYPHFAARFAAKEAVIKALPKPVLPIDIEIIRKSDKIDVRIKNNKKAKIFASLTHVKDTAAAVAAVIGE